ncbi:MAG: hypothetical protein ACREXP_15660 [Steroidobacteraceae bacterium]
MSKVHSSRTRVASGLATLTLLSGCQLAKMQVSPTLAGVEPWPVSRAFIHKPQDPLSFGAWRTTRRYVGWTRRTTAQPDPRDRSPDAQTLEKPIRRGGEVIAAVQITHPGRVWMLPTPGQPDRDRAAAIVTTLLLYESPLAELEREHSHDED